MKVVLLQEIRKSMDRAYNRPARDRDALTDTPHQSVAKLQ